MRINVSKPAINDPDICYFLRNLARSSTIRSIKLPRCNLQPHHLGNYFPRIQTSPSISTMTFMTMNLPFLLMGPATDEKSFAVNHYSDNTLELFINPPPSRTLDIRKNREFENLKCFKFLDNHIDVLQGNISIYFKISPFEIFEFLNFNFY